MQATAAIRIDPEFQSLIPPLSAEELAQLEENLKAEGCRDALVIWKGKGILVDGHNRHAICKRMGLGFEVHEAEFGSRDEAKAWIIRNQLGRRNLTPFVRAELALKLEPLIAAKGRENQAHGQTAPGRPKSLSQNSVKASTKVDTQKDLAKVAGVSHDTIAKTKVIKEKATEPVKAKLRNGETTINKVYKDITKKEKQKAKEEKEAKAVKAPPQGDRYRLLCADIADLAAQVEPESAEWIITDPPYPKDYLDVYDHLGRFALHALKPGGSLLVMVGQSYLPEIMARLCGHLRYHWTVAYLTPGGQSVQLWQRKVNTFWKPLLWLVKGDYGGEWVGDVTRSNPNDNDKRHHDWGQSESGMADVIRRFTQPGQMIVDPFLGGGTTGVVAVALGRRFLGSDRDSKAIETGARRISAVISEENGKP